MKILELSIRNLRKIEAIDISPTGNVIKIEGPNNQGKSTVLDSIFLTLGGKIAFDPMEFMRMDSKKQVDILKKVTGVEEKINKLKDEESASMEERKLVGREKDKLTILCKDKIDQVNEPVSK